MTRMSPDPTLTLKPSGKGLLASRLRHLGRTWLAVELGAGILALAPIVAVGPWVAVLFSRPEYPWVATAAVLSVSVPAAAILGVSGLKLSRDLVDHARLR
jgi:hypothetical protein